MANVAAMAIATPARRSQRGPRGFGVGPRRVLVIDAIVPPSSRPRARSSVDAYIDSIYRGDASIRCIDKMYRTDTKGPYRMLELAILGLLKESSMHGYNLKKRLSETLGSFWQVSYGSLYPALKRLQRRGAVEMTFPMEDVGRRKNVYRITEKGEALF